MAKRIFWYLLLFLIMLVFVAGSAEFVIEVRAHGIKHVLQHVVLGQHNQEFHGDFGCGVNEQPTVERQIQQITRLTTTTERHD